MPLSANPGREVIGNAPRIPAVAPNRAGDEGPQSRPGRIEPMAYDGDEGGFRRFSEDLNGVDGRFGDIPSVSPAAPSFGHFSEDDYVNSTTDNDGHIAPVRHGAR